VTEPSVDPGSAGRDSLLTVVVAFGANLLIAVAKSAAAVITGSASLVAEAAHSWADSGNEVFLLVAQRRGARPADEQHPFGHGRETYVWALFAAVGLFAVGAAVSVTHGVTELLHPEPAQNFAVAYTVLGIAFVLEAISFAQSFRQAHAEASRIDRELLEHVVATSDPTLRAVFAEDAAALVGLVIAFLGVGLHEVTGSTVPDAIGSILVGVLLAVVSLLLIDRNRRFLVGEAVAPALRSAALSLLLAEEAVLSVTYLQMEFAGPRQIALIARVDLVADKPESQVAVTLAELERRIEAEPAIARAILAPAHPGSEPLVT
jgi:cation diffusion facilitator family transporter